VALKVPNPDTVNTPERGERFLREACALSPLQHPHIVPFYEAGQTAWRQEWSALRAWKRKAHRVRAGVHKALASCPKETWYSAKRCST
jgi:serine/threonine protein kinase